jgi:hypothetical protein
MSFIPFGLLICIAWLAAFLSMAAWLFYRGQVLSGALLALGALGFVAVPVILTTTGTLLDGVELPAFFHATTILGPDGKRFALTSHLSRVQRYDRCGRFERGWFVNSGGGRVEIGLTTDGKIAVLAWRPRQVEIFNPDGSPAVPPKSFSTLAKVAMRRDDLCPSEHHLCPSEYLIEGVALQNPTPADNPKPHWNTVLLFPLSSPLVAWLLMGLAVFVYHRRGEGRPDAVRGGDAK